MKPTVINTGSNSETNNPSHQSQQNLDNGNNGLEGQNAGNNDGSSRRFPQFRHGFGFEDPDEDVFANMGLRSRLNRMGNPFDWSARKRRGSGQNANAANDPYEHYFHDDVDFPHFGSTWDAFDRAGNKRSQHPSEVNDRSGFFDYLPAEFRQYIPDTFGFTGGIRHQGQPPTQPTQQQQQHHPQQQYHHPQQQQQQQSHYEPSNSRSNLCDAAIQTEDPGASGNGQNNRSPSNKQPNASQNNSPNDGVHRSSSASASSSSTSTPYGNQTHMSTSADGPGAFSSASAGNPQHQYYQQSPNNVPHFNANQPYGQRNYQQYPYAQPHTQSQSPQQSQSYQGQPQTQQHHQEYPPQQQQPSQGENFVRHVPIFFEGSNVPVNRTTTTASASPSAPAAAAASSPSSKPRPEPFQCKDAFQQSQPIPAPAPPSHQQQSHPEESVQSSESGPDQCDNAADSAPPQTPHTADCIMKIQAIQRDVLDLMCAVEQFGGARGDKEYKFLDEMLTRNLLKLDTIDTNGKESIRMARKEAIKCIQASIAVLEAKADLNLNSKQGNVEKIVTTDSNVEETKEPESERTSNDNMDLDDTHAVSVEHEKNVPESMSTNVSDGTANEIPKVQQNVENITIDDKSKTNDTDAADATQHSEHSTVTEMPKLEDGQATATNQ